MRLTKLLGQLEALAKDALRLWLVPAGASVRLINVSENTTYLVEASGGYRAILRIHREHYHSRRAIECELAWIDALGRSQVIETLSYYRGRDGNAIQQGTVAGLSGPRFMVLFHFISGTAPDEGGDLSQGFEELGSIAARCHEHVMSWPKPQPFVRLVWDLDSVFGGSPTWGRWRDAPGVDKTVASVLQQVESTNKNRLTIYGQSAERFNLIHADMRLANLLVGGATTRLIDFDDCGFGWLMYDFAAAISFFEDDPRIAELKAAWLQGYRTVREVSAEDEAEMDTLTMLRRMALLAWIGSHIEAPEPQLLAPDFAKNTAKLGRLYLDSQKIC